MYNEKLLGYVILKCASMISGQRGRKTLIRFLNGKETFENTSLGGQEIRSHVGILRHIPDNKIEELIERLIGKAFLYIDNVQIGNYKYPMVFISNEGLKLLKGLEKSEEAKLEGLKTESENTGALVSTLGESAVRLGHFLDSLFVMLTRVKAEIDKENFNAEKIQDELGLDNEVFSGGIKLLNSLLYNASRSWDEPESFNKIYDRFNKEVRELLGYLPEKQAVVFRLKHNIKDAFYKPREVVLEYYDLNPDDLQSVYRQVINKFLHKKYKRKFWLIRNLNSILFGSEGLSMSNDGIMQTEVKTDTYEETYNLYKEGLSIDEIADARGLKKSTILGHFVKLIPEYGINPYDIVDKERIHTILRVAEMVGRNNLREIKERLPEGFYYGEISIALTIEKDKELM
ncbi:MAG: helix-turn-helix domain-containing protein [Bacillota bacterium]